MPSVEPNSVASPLNVPVTAPNRVAVTGAGGATWDDLRKKAFGRLAERVDPVRNKHKPVSILRQESRRTVEQFFDAEYPYVSKPERAKFIEDIVSEAVGLGPLEELFRDETIVEILILAPNQIIVRRGETWLPTSVVLRDPTHLRTMLTRMTEQGEPMYTGADSKAAIDVKLPNGFRVLAVVPPDVLNLSPAVTFVRFTGVPTNQTINVSGVRTGSGSPTQSPMVGSNVFTTPAPRGGSGITSTPGPRSGIIPAAGPRSGAGLLGGTVKASEAPLPGSTIIGMAATNRSVSESPNSGIYGNDPYSKMRGRITQRLITKIAAAGIYDIQQIPKAEMQRIVSTLVVEANTADKLGLDAAEESRLTLEILTAMQV